MHNPINSSSLKTHSPSSIPLPKNGKAKPSFFKKMCFWKKTSPLDTHQIHIVDSLNKPRGKSKNWKAAHLKPEYRYNPEKKYDDSLENMRDFMHEFAGMGTEAVFKKYVDQPLQDLQDASEKAAKGIKDIANWVLKIKEDPSHPLLKKINPSNPSHVEKIDKLCDKLQEKLQSRLPAIVRKLVEINVLKTTDILSGRLAESISRLSQKEYTDTFDSWSMWDKRTYATPFRGPKRSGRSCQRASEDDQGSRGNPYPGRRDFRKGGRCP